MPMDYTFYQEMSLIRSSYKSYVIIYPWQLNLVTTVLDFPQSLLIGESPKRAALNVFYINYLLKLFIIVYMQTLNNILFWSAQKPSQHLKIILKENDCTVSLCTRK